LWLKWGGHWTNSNRKAGLWRREGAAINSLAAAFIGACASEISPFAAGRMPDRVRISVVFPARLFF
jgi:hypothetical protein